MLRSDDDDRSSNVLVPTGNIHINETEGDSTHSIASDDLTRVHPSTMATTSSSPPPPPALPFRSKVDRRKGVFRKARASSPPADVTEGEGERNSPSPPPIPPRLPPRLNQSLDCNQRLSRRPTHAPRSPVVLLLSTANDFHDDLSAGAELLQSRPPPPPPAPRESDSSAAPTIPSVVPSDVDLARWPSRERRLNSQLHQLSHWPIADTEQPTTGGSRRMNDYIDSPIASHSNAQIAADGLEVTVNSEASDVSFDQHLRPDPSVAALPPSTKVKPGVHQRTTQCRQRVTCVRCGKCLCKQCTVARPLPRCWAGQCECSARSAVDCCTCMCCARALFYHCRTTEDDDFSDDPCACTEQRDCCKRWTLLTLLSLCLPCLCLYCPLVGAVSLCTACYNRRRNSRGCCCCDDERRRTEASKGLLIESESSSS